MRKNRFGKRVPALILAVFLFVGTLTGCTRELTEQQSAALVALQNAVTYYETTDTLSHWEELVALAAANRADGIGINWNALTLPETPKAPILVTPQNSAGNNDGQTEDSSGLVTNQPDVNSNIADGDESITPILWTPIDVSSYPAAIMSSIIKGEDYTDMVASLLSGQNPENGAFSTVNINQHIWSMITLTVAAGKDGYDYDKAAAYLLTFQREDGGFGYAIDSTESDVDLTGIASIALSPYYDKHKKSVEMKSLVSFYDEKQTADGGYEGFGGETPSTIAAAIWGLTALNRDLPLTEDGLSPVDALLTFQNEDGSFRVQKDGDHIVDASSTRQATIALCDVVNDVNTYALLAEDAESYRIDNVSGPAITLSIVYPHGADLTDVSTPLVIEEGSSVLDALLLYGKIKEIPISFSGKEDSGYVQSINSIVEKEYGDTSGWIYTVNDQTMPQSASTVILKEGDTVSWLFVKNINETNME